ncbi:MAG: lactate racemase domain-containing protein [Desulfobulbus sp.]|jgi:nickel-dependent lactate racemase|uniref:lactate racemase domain-containing protein n=1 Tax=Desulfobulbus sp. TaxID=895 RepID=UPI00284DD823|nr:lactate racemase domain-containing protein [Desulfobulbus sp.]MDR2550500.1 lactate racemase domain-containing protein [Desulfobulbus sp.]
MSAARTLCLRYGRGRLDCAVPAHADILEPREPVPETGRAAFRAGLDRLLPQPLPPGPIVIVVADKTRLCGYPTVLPWLVEALHEQGAERSRIAFHIAYGTHAPQSEDESLAAYGPIYADFPFVHHHCSTPTRFAELGRTSRGTPVRIRAELAEAGLILTVGAIAHHYFAGFGGGRKLLFPGLGEREAIYANHRLFLDSRHNSLASGCRPGQMAGNPLAEDLAEADRLLPPYLSIHGLLDSRGEVAAYRFGANSADFLAACREHDALYRLTVARPYDLVLASAGGFPKDINLIQSHKAIDNAAAFVRDGGSLILLAECIDGLGSATFLPYFEMGGPQAAFRHLAQQYSGNGGTALALMAKTARIRIELVTALDSALCHRLGMAKIDLDRVQRRIAAAETMAVLPNAAMLIRGKANETTPTK